MSRARLDEHRQLWEKKRTLRDVYGVWFEALLALMPGQARVLELGAGPGFLAAYARSHRPDLRWIGTDILTTPWNDVSADCLRLPFRDGCVQSAVGLDFVHHLARPARFFAEAARVLVPGGSLVVCEPWVTPFSYPVYRWFHQEGCRLGLDPWNPFGAGEEKDAFEGDAAVMRRLLLDTPAARWNELGFEAPERLTLNGFAYLASLGFRPGSLAPGPAGRALIRLDHLTRWMAPLTGLRAVVVWKRRPEAGAVRA